MKKLGSLLLWLALAQAGQAVSVLPFTESFEASSSGWVYGTSSAPAWSATGGVGNSGFISAPATVSGSGFGAIVFRGNDANNASGDAFVGNWLTAGVTTFSAYVRHNADVALNFYARFDAGAGRAGSSVNFLVNPNSWTLLQLPILNEITSFQSYGAAGTGQAAFNTIFGGIQNVQIALSVDTVNAGKTVTLDLDGVSMVPEPTASVLLMAAGAALLASRRLRLKRS
ncbi:MAG: hypothetical protein RL549_1455 [Verrucomicrobiota bacterium]|jgi:hypothetical protein